MEPQPQAGGLGTPVGIDHIGIYLPGFVLSLETLAKARGVPPEKILVGIGAQQMAVTPPWEDAVSLAANAAARVFASGQVRPEEIGLLIVGTETAVDHAKPASIFLHDLLGIPANCRTFELKHACYGGTAGVMMAADWIRSGAARGRKALVVTTDIARYDLCSSAEFTQGAGAVALVVSERPRLLQLEPASGVFARNVYDFWRPLERREAVVDGKFSVDCYLEALEGAYADYRLAAGVGPREAVLPRFAAMLYHTPFPKMAYKAHLRLLSTDLRHASGRSPDQAEADHSFASLADHALAAVREVGNAYTASLYLCLAWLAEQSAAQLEGQEISLFSYGSGCCAEFFTGRFVAGSGAIAAQIGMAELLARRQRLTVEEYEAFMRASSEQNVAMPWGPNGGAFHFTGVRDLKRFYERGSSLRE